MESKVEFGFQDADESAGYLLWQVHMIWQRRIKEELDKLNLTHTQFVLLSVLAWLSHSNDSVSQSEIAQHSQTDRMMVSKVLRTLEGKGYVARSDHQSDTRVKIVSLTEIGAEILQKAVIVVEMVDTNFFSHLDTHKNLFTSNLNELVKSNS